MKIKLNLIPPSRKEEIEKAKNFKLLFRIGASLLAIAIIFWGALWSFHYFLQIDKNLAQKNLEVGNKAIDLEKIEKYDQKFKEANIKIGKIDQSESNQIYWSNLLLILEEKIPLGIKVSHLATKDYQVLITGEANSREDLVDLKEKLENVEDFQDINLPLSDLVAKNNVSFQLEFEVKRDFLKE